MKYMIFIFCLILALTQAFATSIPAFYREITIAGKQTPGDHSRNSAKLTFFMPDEMKSSRLIDAGGQERGITILMRQGSQISVFFDGSPGEEFSMEFYREPEKRKTAEQTSGLLHLVKIFNAGAVVNNVEDFRKLWDTSGEPVGSFTKKVFSGVNPYSQNMNSIHIYKGFINIPSDGNYIFYTASTDASFLLIDNKAIAAWPGKHWVGEGLCGAYNGTVKLTKGVHRFEYLHANSQWPCYAIAAFSCPNDKNMTVIPDKMFTAALEAVQGPLLDMQGHPLLDFSWENESMLALEKLQMHCIVCKPANVSGQAKWNWGDNTLAQNNRSVHYYFKQGKYPAALEAGNGRSAQQIEVAYRFEQQLIPDDEAAKMVSEAVEQEKTIGIQREGYAFITNAILQLKMKKLAVEFYPRALEKHNLIPPDLILNYFQELILEDLLKSEKYEEAENEFKKFLAQIKNPKCLAPGKLEYARLLFYCMGRNADAEKQLNEIDRKYIPVESKQLCDILQADLTLFNKGFEEASQFYERLNSMSQKIDRRQKIMAGGMIISIRNCIIMKKYDEAMAYIEQIENSQPESRLNPELILIKAKALKNLGMPRRAAVCYETVLKLNPAASTAASANLELAEYCRKSCQYHKAREYLNNILTEAPRSHEAVSAGRILNDIGRKEEKNEK
jgi:tetratricopeptide (TPR) repeat protein